MTNIGFILGDWSRNIGNAYFQLGGYYALQKALPSARIAILPEQPGYPSYWNPRGGNPANFFDMSSVADIDYLVLMGPMLRPETKKIWTESLSKILSSGTRLILLGIGAMQYDQENRKVYREFLRQFPPYIFTSRDTETYEALGDLAENAYNGIDFAFFLPDLYSPVGFKKDDSPYLALNFDKVPEPTIRIEENFPQLNGKKKHFLNRTFTFDSSEWVIEFPSFRSALAGRSRYFMFLEGMIYPGEQTTQIGRYQIIRTDHRPHPMVPKKTYRSPNMMVNDTPYPYLEIYSQAVLTLSDRLHACVVALSYGKHAMLFSSSPRIRLLERIGLSDITQHPVCLSEITISREKEALLNFLIETLNKDKSNS